MPVNTKRRTGKLEEINSGTDVSEGWARGGRGGGGEGGRKIEGKTSSDRPVRAILSRPAARTDDDSLRRRGVCRQLFLRSVKQANVYRAWTKEAE